MSSRWVMGRRWVAGMNWEGRKEEKLWLGYKIITILLLLNNNNIKINANIRTKGGRLKNPYVA